MRTLLLTALVVLTAAPAGAQVTRDYLRLDGPRFGFTYLPPEIVDKVNAAYADFDCYDAEAGVRARCDVIGDVPVVSQFGWQFERRFFQTEQGVAGVTEWIPLVGGLERGVFLPSLTFLIGLRGATGLEAGLGPNVTATGTGLALAVGMNNDVGGLNVPINVAAVLGREGARGSVLVGFNLASNAPRDRVPAPAALPVLPAPSARPGGVRR